jgi:predicted transglutaminase-like cysteine proteinase
LANKVTGIVDVSGYLREMPAKAQDLAKRITAQEAINPFNTNPAVMPLLADTLQRVQNYKGGHKGELAVVDVIDQLVNDRIKYTNDKKSILGLKFSVDIWSTGTETAEKRTGDCEDFAILKAQMLIANGVSPDKLKVMILASREPDKSGHAVLTYTDDKGQVHVLNNSGESKDRIANMMPLDNYLKGEIGVGGDLVPVGTFDIRTGKFQPSEHVVDGKIDLSKAIPRDEKPLPSLAKMMESKDLKLIATTLVAAYIGQGVTPDGAEYSLKNNPKDFAAFLKEAMGDPKSPAQKLDPDVKLILNHFADQLEKHAPAPTTPAAQATAPETPSGPTTTAEQPAATAPADPAPAPRGIDLAALSKQEPLATEPAATAPTTPQVETEAPAETASSLNASTRPQVRRNVGLSA